MAQATRDIVGDVLGEIYGLTPGQLRRLMRDLPLKHRRELIERWQGWAQDGQCEPPGDWRIWMIRAGRGFGKTRAGAEWISEWARERVESALAAAGFAPVTDVACVGDVALIGFPAGQFHLGLLGRDRVIHAHAGLRRVVAVPLDAMWRGAQRFRMAI